MASGVVPHIMWAVPTPPRRARKQASTLGIIPSFRMPEEVSGPRSASLISGMVEDMSSNTLSTPGTSVTSTMSVALIPAAKAAAAVSALTFMSLPSASPHME